jgi:hypothetical protein
MNREAITKMFHIYFGHLVDHQGKRVKPSEITDWFMDNVAIHLSNQGENQRASVARGEDQGVAADNQISLSVFDIIENFLIRHKISKPERDAIHAQLAANYEQSKQEFLSAGRENYQSLFTTCKDLAAEVERLRGEREALRDLVLYAKGRIASVDAKDLIDDKLSAILNPKPDTVHE